MKRLPLVFVLLTSYCWATCNTVVQHKSSGSSGCSVSGTTCSMTVTSTGSGHIIVVGAMVGTTGSTPTISSVSGGGTYTHCTNCSAKDSGNDVVDISYTLNSTSGSTTITVTMSAAPGGSEYVVAMAEISCTGTPALDTSGSGVINTACTSCTGQALTLTGSSDGIFQIITPDNLVSAVSSPYSSNADFPGSGDGGAGTAVSQSSGTAPTWTASSGVAAVAGIAFNDSAALHNAMPFVALLGKQ